jgi:DNA-binding MarR family transcriptional regulator
LVARGLLSGGVMNAMFFGAKRAYHGTLRICRKPLRSLGLTAARYDMMYVLMQKRAVLQSDVRRNLGVCRSVVSRMLRSLEALGWVTRIVKRKDTRQRWVKLTEAGLRCIRTAYNVLARASMRLVYIAICSSKKRDREKQLDEMFRLECYFDAIRYHYGDTATLYYRWGHPDD